MSKPDRYEVIGHPIAHSKSPVIHRLFAEQTGEQISYTATDVPPSMLREHILEFTSGGGRGLNVTVPHKQEVLVLMDEISERAGIAGAVNTITLTGDGKLAGDNTDGLGLITDLRKNLGIVLENKRILVLGAGGATRGIIPALLGEKPADLLIANRTVEKARVLAKEFSPMGSIGASDFADLGTESFDVVLNATSAGLDGEVPPFSGGIISPDTVCYDLSYSMRDTPFMIWAKAQGAVRVYKGWGMLVEQAAESFRIWRGVKPDTSAVLSRLR